MYDKQPYIAVSSDSSDCYAGWNAIGATLRASVVGERCIVCVECYPGVRIAEVTEQLNRAFEPQLLILSEGLFLSPADLQDRVSPMLTDDPVFGVMNRFEIRDFFRHDKLAWAQDEIQNVQHGIVLVIGTGAVEVVPTHDILIYADLARWEIQLRQRRGEIGNLGADNLNESPAQKYKRAFFLDWRAADRSKQRVDRKSTRLNSSHQHRSRMPSSA